jgi:hypothetical protein
MFPSSDAPRNEQKSFGELNRIGNWKEMNGEWEE